MTDEEYKGQSILTEMIARFDGNEWTVTQKITQKRSDDPQVSLDEWESESVETTASHKNLNQAMKAVASMVEAYLIRSGGNLFEASEEELPEETVM